MLLRFAPDQSNRFIADMSLRAFAFATWVPKAGTSVYRQPYMLGTCRSNSKQYRKLSSTPVTNGCLLRFATLLAHSAKAGNSTILVVKGSPHCSWCRPSARVSTELLIDQFHQAVMPWAL
jgi:hypothetical protein